MSSANAIPLSRTTAFSQITGVVYAKPNVTANPPSACKFWAETSAPASLAHIYSTAAGATSSGAVNADHTGWPPNTPKTKFDVNLPTLGFSYPDIVAIAFNLDDSVNTNPFYTYHFEYDGTGSFVPTEAIMEGSSTTTLSWIAGDDFSGGVVNGVGKTVVVVCPMVQSSTFNLIAFNLGVTAVNPNDPDDTFTTIFDPFIKNRGGPPP
jgi:hypothetical protein